MSGIRLFTKYHTQSHLFYICSLLQIFAISDRTEIFYEVEKGCIWEKCDVLKVAFEKEKEKSNNGEDMCWCVQKGHIYQIYYTCGFNVFHASKFKTSWVLNYVWSFLSSVILEYKKYCSFFLSKGIVWPYSCLVSLFKSKYSVYLKFFCLFF